MRIRRICLRNINSLKGDWSFDFTGGAYDGGLFAISGDTGSGKTTILDALSVALYGRTPRLDGITKTDNGIMTKGTGECTAQAVFSAGGRTYLAQWEQRRARGRPDGTLQQQQHRLSVRDDGDTEWLPLTSRLRDTESRVAEVTGMDFQQFTRSMLLAQGSFSSFLNAEPDERAKILEKITDTSIYSEISMRVQQRCSDEKRKLEGIEALLKEQAPLSAEARMDVEGRRLRQEAIREEKAALAKNVDRLTEWCRSVEKARSEVEKAGKVLDGIKGEKRSRSDDYTRLNAAERAAKIRAEGTALETLRNQAGEKEREAAKLAEETPKLEKALADAGSAREKAQQHLEAGRKEQGALAELCTRVRKIDVRRGEAAKALGTAREELETARDRLSGEQAELEKKRSELLKKQEEANSASAWLDGRRYLESLPDAIGGIDMLRESLKKAVRHCSEREEADRKAAAAAEGARSVLEGAEAADRAGREALAKLEEKFSSLVKERDEKLAGRNMTDLSDEQGKLSLIAEKASAAADTLGKLADNAGESKNTESELSSLVEQKRKADEGLAKEKDRIGELSRDIENLEKLIRALEKIESLEDHRKRLEPGCACPLCGSTDHPYCGRGIPRRTGEEEQLREKQAARESSEREKNRLANASAEAGGEIKACGERLKGLGAEKIRLEGEISGLLEKISQASGAPAPADEPSLRKAAGDASMKAAALKADIRTLDSLRRRIDRAERARDTGREAAREQERELQAARLSAARLEESAAAARSELESAKTAKDAALGSFTEAVTPYISTVPDENSCGRIFTRLRRLAGEWEGKTKERDDAAGDARTISGEIERLTRSCQELAKEKEQRAGAEKACSDSLARLESERSRLFGNDDPDEKEREMKDRVETAESKLSSSREAFSNAEKALAEHRASVNANLAEQEKLKADIAANGPAWETLRTAAGFADDGAWRDACMEEGERESLARELRGIDDRIAAGEGRLEAASKSLNDLEEQKLSDRPLAGLEEEKRRLEEEIGACNKEIGSLGQQLEADDKVISAQKETLEKKARQQDILGKWAVLNRCIGHSDGKDYRMFVQSLTLDALAAFANRALEKIDSRYTLISDGRLGLNVADWQRGGDVRPVKNLSGGESFIVSLALALGLSDMASRNISIESLFLDEGFGTLDQQSLSRALDALGSLAGGGRLVGVISHVPQVCERIAARIDARKLGNGTSMAEGPGVTRSIIDERRGAAPAPY